MSCMCIIKILIILYYYFRFLNCLQEVFHFHAWHYATFSILIPFSRQMVLMKPYDIFGFFRATHVGFLWAVSI